METSRVSDFSIERILSPQLGHDKAPPDIPPNGCLQRIPAEFNMNSGHLRPPAVPVPVPIPVPVPVLFHDYLRYRGMGFGDAFRPHGAGFYHTDYSSVDPESAFYARFSSDTDPQPLAGYRGYHPAFGVPAQAQQRQKARMRTVFTDCQAKQLEALFELTDYPPVETRVELARSTGLSEETVRVWFKNRRARRKRQRGGSKIKSPSGPRAMEPDRAEKNHLSSFL